MTVTCASCGNDFEVKPSLVARGARYCSKPCHDKGLQKVNDYVCTSCGKQKTADDFYVDSNKPRGRVARCKDCYREKQRTVVNFKPYRREGAYRRDAKKRGLAYELTREQFLSFWQKPCAYCGDDIATVGLDRVDNARGYVIDNVVACCRLCNAMKSGMPLADFVERCRLIADRATPAAAETA